MPVASSHEPSLRGRGFQIWISQRRGIKTRRKPQSGFCFTATQKFSASLHSLFYGNPENCTHLSMLLIYGNPKVEHNCKSFCFTATQSLFRGFNLRRLVGQSVLSHGREASLISNQHPIPSYPWHTSYFAGLRILWFSDNLGGGSL